MGLRGCASGVGSGGRDGRKEREGREKHGGRGWGIGIRRRGVEKGSERGDEEGKRRGRSQRGDEGGEGCKGTGDMPCVHSPFSIVVVISGVKKSAPQLFRRHTMQSINFDLGGLA